MNKIGIYRIGFKEQNEVNDQWVQQEEHQERSIPDVYIDGSHWFKSIDQKNSSLEEVLVNDESGTRYETTLSFVVRKSEDMTLAKKYDRRPVIMYVRAVDGSNYTIGTKTYPVMMLTENRYDAMNTREISVTVRFDSLYGIMQ